MAGEVGMSGPQRSWFPYVAAAAIVTTSMAALRLVPYTLNGFTYNLQSLVFIDYSGAPRSRRVNGWLSFQNDESNVCPGQ